MAYILMPLFTMYAYDPIQYLKITITKEQPTWFKTIFVWPNASVVIWVKCIVSLVFIIYFIRDKTSIGSFASSDLHIIHPDLI